MTSTEQIKKVMENNTIEDLINHEVAPEVLLALYYKTEQAEFLIKLKDDTNIVRVTFNNISPSGNYVELLIDSKRSWVECDEILEILEILLDYDTSMQRTEDLTF